MARGISIVGEPVTCLNCGTSFKMRRGQKIKYCHSPLCARERYLMTKRNYWYKNKHKSETKSALKQKLKSAPPDKKNRYPFLTELFGSVRPQTVADCQPGGINGARPCQRVICDYHLAVEMPGMRPILNSREYAERLTELLPTMTYTCVLDAIEAGVGALRMSCTDDHNTLSEIANFFGVTRQRIRQIEANSIHKLRHPKYREFLVDFTIT